MKKSNLKVSKMNLNYIFILLIAILSITNIVTLYKYNKDINSQQPEIIYKDTNSKSTKDKDTNYNENKTYYKNIKYSEFTSLYKADEISVIAIVDNTSYTYEKFIELINKTSYYKDITINLLELSKLSKKNEIAFYEIDERFSKLESDYIIVVKDKKILTLIGFESADLNTLLSIFE